MVCALVVFLFRVCDAVFENDRNGPSGMRGMFGERRVYHDGSIGIEIEANVGIYGNKLKNGVAYATASIDHNPLWMLQIDGATDTGGRLELVSHVMDAGDTSTLLILEHSMNLLLQQFVTATRLTPLKTMVNSYNTAVRQTNADPDWKVMKMPLLHFTNAAPDGISTMYFGWDKPHHDLGVQINFGVPVETFTPSRINEFLLKHCAPAHIQKYIQYLTRAVDMADKWVATFFAMSNLQFTSEEQGILALTIAKTLGKQAFFGPLEYNDVVRTVNHIRALKGERHTSYKNAWLILAKVNVRELISAAPAGSLHSLLRLLSSEDFLRGRAEWAEEQAVADIQRLVDRSTLAVTAPVDDDCFVDANRVFPPQRHSDGRLAIVMETRFDQPHSVWMRTGFLIEAQSTVDAVKRYQALYGDLMGSSYLRAFVDFEVAAAITKLPEYRRVTLNFDTLDTVMIQKYVVPLAKDTQFLRSLRRIGDIRKIDFRNRHHISSMNRATIVDVPGRGLSINVDSINGGTETAASDLCQALTSYINENSRRVLKGKFMQIQNIAREFNVRRTDELNLVDFNTVERFRLHFATEIHTRLLHQRVVFGAPDSLTVLAKWAAFHGATRLYGWPSIDIPCLVDDLKRTLEMWIDMDLNESAVRAYHSDDSLQAKFYLLARELKKYHVRTQICA